MNKNWEKVLVNRWSIVDVSSIVICVLFLIVVLFLLTTFFDNEKSALLFFNYSGFLVFVFVPILWLKIKYRLKSDVLGLRKGHYSLKKLILIGCFTAVLLTLMLRFSPLWQISSFNTTTDSINYLHIILYPISIGGFVIVVLTPIGEEILFRGFLYGYLRLKTGIVLGLLLQAGLFTVIHMIYLFEDASKLIFFFLTGIVFGILYELTGSLYSSIISHSVLNYSVVILSVYS